MPWAKTSMSSGLAPAASSAARTASIAPSDWSFGVLGALAVCRCSPATSTASVNVPPTSTPSSMARERTAAAPARARRCDQVRVMAGLRRSCLGGDRRRHRHDLDLLRLGKVLVRRAVAVAVQRHALARRAAAGGRAALQRVPVGVESGARQSIERVRGAGHIALNDAPHTGPRADVEMRADVAEQRPRRAGEVVLVADHAFDRRLTGAKDRFVLLPTTGDVWRQLP